MIYLHIPFCKQKCSYCNFHFSTSLKQKDEMISAIKKEIFLRKEELENKTLSSLYFGGGTPSILSVDEIKSLIDEVLKYFDFEKNIEITLEANPDDLDKNFLKDLAKTEINRLSIGTQSFFEEDLKLMNRAHNASEAESSIKRAQDFGFENLSIDLIYGSPTSNFEIWRENLQKTKELQVPHVSSYALTIEPKTALNAWIKKIKSQNRKKQSKIKSSITCLIFQKTMVLYITRFLILLKKILNRSTIQRIGNIKNTLGSGLLHILITVETSAVGMLRITPFTLKI